MSFDSVDIEGRPSISVRDLRSKIVRHKNLNICHDFDLVFSDAVTGQEYVDENFQIPSGSSIIIKRIPAGSVPSAAKACIDSSKHVGSKDANLVHKNVEIDDFDDFGIDLCPVPQPSFCDSDLDIDKMNCSGSEIKPSTVPRCSKPPVIVCQKLESSDLSEASPRGSTHKVQGNTPQTKSKPKVEEQTKLEKVAHANPQAIQNVDLPSEMKCSLCNTYFKKAVMIPCCQHSFCEKCIHLVLVEKAQCPKCSSTKCRVEDLLPNLSLRQAIDHFLESQILLSGSDDAFHRYAPDGESGIQANDFSFAGTILQKDLDLPHSPSATGKGSNYIMTESAYDSTSRNNASMGIGGSHRFDSAAGKSLKSAPLSQKIKQIVGENDDFQGENIPTNLCKSRVPEEADSTLKKKKELWVNTSGGGQSVIPNNGRNKKGDRACYTCGSPDHLMRDCPAALSQNAMLQTGAMFPGVMPGLSPYWNGTPSPYSRPSVNMYGNPGMMAFNATMVPVTPFAVPAYVPSMYCGLPVNGGYMGMGGLAPPVGTSAERPLSHPEFSELHDCRKKQKLLNHNMKRDEDEDLNKWYRYNDAERSHGHKPHIEREKSISDSEDSSTQRLKRKNRHDKRFDDDIHYGDERHEKSSRPIVGRDRKPYHTERSSLEIDDMPYSSSWHSEDRHKNHHESSKKHNDQRGQCSSDSSRSRHHTKHQKDDERNIKKQSEKHHRHSQSGSEQGSATQQIKQVKERDSRHGLGHDRHNAKSMNNDHEHDRWQMATGSDHDHRDEHPRHKRKKVH